MFKTADSKHELYRIGDCIISVNTENPSQNFGGQWELLCPGRTLVCVDTSQSEFNSLKKTGGEKNHKLSVSEIPSHNHSAATNTPSLKGSFKNRYYDSKGSTDIVAIDNSETGIVTVERSIVWSGAHGSPQSLTSNVNNPKINKVNIDASHSHTITVSNTGGGTSHNNLQPFMAVYIWVRVG